MAQQSNRMTRDDRRETGQLRAFARIANGIVLLIGLWLIASPWLLGYADRAGTTWSNVVGGGLLAAVATARLIWPLRQILGGLPAGSTTGARPTMANGTDGGKLYRSDTRASRSGAGLGERFSLFGLDV